MINLNQAINLLKNNHIIIVPTDTVYGLVTKTSDYNGKMLAILKGNNLDKKYTIMVRGPIEALELWDDNLLLTKLVNKYFPGNLTIIAKAQDKFLGIRIPNYHNLLEIITYVGPIFATSVNKSGKKPLTTIKQMKKDFPYIKILEGKCVNSKPSTIIKVEGNNFSIIRQGELTIPLIKD